MSPAASTLRRSAAALLAASLAACGGEPDASTLIVDARVVDGTGSPPARADVRIRGPRITAVGELEPAPGDTVVPARGRALAPGFIDTHSHHDRGLREHPAASGAVSQGVTTIVVGQDGGSHVPLDEYFRALRASPVAVNVASYAGHGTIRRSVMGDDYRRRATREEVEEMTRILRRELESGALGLSTGLEYDPGAYATTGEVVALAREAARAGGRYVSHVRSEDRRLWSAVDEAVRIGRASGAAVHISHMKLAMRSLWGDADRLLARLQAARDSGVAVSADVYPYTYWQSTMRVFFPERDFDDYGAAAFALRELTTPAGVLIASFAPEPSYTGRTLAEVAQARGTDPARTLLDLVAEARAYERRTGDRGESVIVRSMHEDDVRTLLGWRHTNIGSDGALRGRHPRGYGTFPRVLGRYVRREELLSLEEAVHKMSALAARHVGLRGRGVIRRGAYADLVLFDPARVIDRATPEAPRRTAAGIERVWVNGRTVYRDGQTTGARPGRVIRRAARSAAGTAAAQPGE